MVVYFLFDHKIHLTDTCPMATAEKSGAKIELGLMLGIAVTPPL